MPRGQVHRKYTPEEDEQIRAAAAAGESLNSTARKLNRTPGSIHNRSDLIGVTWSSSDQTAKANDARRLQCAEIRGQLELDYLLDAQRFRRKNLEPYRYSFIGGTVDTDEPYPGDQLKFQQTSIASLNASIRISEHAAGANVERGRSLLADVAAALGVNTNTDVIDDGEDDES
jgi:hypothetical protein